MQDVSTTNRNITVFGVLGEAWRLTTGVKWAIWAPFLVMMLIYSIAALLAGVGVAAFHTDVKSLNGVGAAVLTIGVIVGFSFLYLLFGCMCGVLKVSIERGRGREVTGKTGFHSFSRVVPMVLTIIVAFIILAPQMLFQFIPGLNVETTEAIIIVTLLETVYGLFVGSLLYMSFPLIVDKVNSPLTAIGRSIKTCFPHWFKLIGIYIMVELISMATMAPFLLGSALKSDAGALLGAFFMFVAFIWILPFMFLVQGVIYHKLMD